jgi:hypothetical protein
VKEPHLIFQADFVKKGEPEYLLLIEGWNILDRNTKMFLFHKYHTYLFCFSQEGTAICTVTL